MCKWLWHRIFQILPWNPAEQQKNTYISADVTRELFIHSRGKLRNITTTWSANCGKTFISKPLQNIYHAFSIPANEKYFWVCADHAEVIIQDKSVCYWYLHQLRRINFCNQQSKNWICLTEEIIVRQIMDVCRKMNLIIEHIYRASPFTIP